MKVTLKNRIPYAWLLWVPAGAYALGYIMNSVVMAANGGQMPVLVPGGCTEATSFGTYIHTCMTNESRLKFLSDWVVMQQGVASPGDFLLWFSEPLFVPGMSAWVALVVRKAIVRR